MKTVTLVPRASLVALTLALGACGGGGDSMAIAPAPPPSDAADAAAKTAQNNPNCQAIGSFYWEIGDVNGARAWGSIIGADNTTYTASTLMNIASASKWLYGAYAVEKIITDSGALDPNRGGVPGGDAAFLNFTSGYAGFGSSPGCGFGAVTVNDCLGGGRGDQIPAAVGHFDYDAGHIQKHASLIGLGSSDAAQLGNVIGKTLVPDAPFELTYFNPQLAGDGNTSAQWYARFLRRLLVGSSSPLKLASMLGTHPTCTTKDSPCNAVSSPTTNPWHYSLGSWIEDDADTLSHNNGAYSSAGAFGFYPWVDTSRTHYGIVAREVIGVFSGVNEPDGDLSSQCGKEIRLAYKTGVEQ